MSRTATAILLASAIFPSAVLGKQSHFLSSRQDLQPQVVAHTLLKVEQEWRDQAAAFVLCDAGEGDACNKSSRAFVHSCGTVVQAMLAASSGDRNSLQEYIKDVCDQQELNGWRKKECQAMGSSVVATMSVDAYANREDFDVSSPCQNFWQNFVEDEKARNKEAQIAHAAEREAEEKRMEKANEDKQLEDKKEAEARAAEKTVRDAKRNEEDEELKKIETRRKAAGTRAKRIADRAAATQEQASRQESEIAKLIESARKTTEEAKQLPKYTVGISAEPWVSNSSSTLLVVKPEVGTNATSAVNSTASSDSAKVAVRAA